MEAYSAAQRSELETQHAAVEADPFTAMMQAGFGGRFGAGVEDTPPGDQANLTPEQIDAEVASFVAQLNGFDNMQDDKRPQGMSESDVDFLQGNQISMRALTPQEMAQVEANERRARAANEFGAFVLQQMAASDPTTKSKKKTFADN